MRRMKVVDSVYARERPALSAVRTAVTTTAAPPLSVKLICATRCQLRVAMPQKLVPACKNK